MDHSHGTAQVIPRFFWGSIRFCGLVLIGLLLLTPVGLTTETELRLVDTQLSQVIELYSKETGKNVFVDETVQKNRLVTAHLPGMGIEEAFEVIKEMVNLQSCPFGKKGYQPESCNFTR